MCYATDLASFARFALRCHSIALALLAAALLAENAAVAIEWVKETSDFLVRRYYKRFKIRTSAAVFFKTRPHGERRSPTLKCARRRADCSELGSASSIIQPMHNMGFRSVWKNNRLRNPQLAWTAGHRIHHVCDM